MTLEHTKQEENFVELLDDAKFGSFHLRTIMVSGVGFLTDAYDLFIIAMVSPMLGWIESPTGKLDPVADGWLKSSAAWGTLLGQLLFGFLADKLGRKSMYGVVLMIIIGGTIASTLSGSSQALSIVATLALWRLFLGIGIGGDYPLSGVITSEFANTSRRGMMIAAVFAMQGIGILLAALISTLVLICFKSKIEQDHKYYLDIVWRLCIGMGAIPGLIAVYFRLQIPESPRFSANVLGQVEKAIQDTQQVMVENSTKKLLTDIHTFHDEPSLVKITKTPPKSTFLQYFSQWQHLKVLLGTSVTWFCLDVGFYGTNLNTPVILKAMGLGATSQPFQSLWNIAVGNLIIALLGAVPGYWFTVFFIEKLGRKPIQLGGFFLLTVLFAILAAYYNQLKSIPTAFVAMYALIQFFKNFGPNATTFVIAGEVFPTRFRATAHGIAAASGKAGAILAAQGFSTLKDIGGPDQFVSGLLWIFCAFMAVGFLFTFLVPETKGKSLEELSRE